LLECGFAACPDNPVTYELLKRASWVARGVPRRSARTLRFAAR